MKTFVVVLNFNDHVATLRCIESLRGEPEVSQILVVDNGSDPQDRDALAVGMPEGDERLLLIRSAVNVGFGGGMNIGIASALESRPDSVLLLNNDTVVRHGAVTALRQALFAEDDIGIAVPVVTTGESHKLWAAGGDFDPLTLRVSHRLAGQTVPEDVPATDLSFAPGAALLVRPAVFEGLGGFVEEFFLYYEDVEFSWRTTRAGYRIRLSPAALVWHAVQGGHSDRTARSVYFRTRNSLWLHRIHRVRLRRHRVFGLPRLAARGAKLALEKAGPHPRHLVPALGQMTRGLVDGLRPGHPVGGLAPRTFVSRGQTDQQAASAGQVSGLGLLACVDNLG